MTDDTTTPTNASPDEPTPAISTAYPENDSAANAAIVGRPTPSPDQLVPQTTSAAKFESSSSPSEDVEVGGEPSNDCTPDEKDDTTSQSGNAISTASRLDDVKDSFISTPSPFKKQVAALAGINDDNIARSERTKSIVPSDNVGQEDMELPPLPPAHMQLPPLPPAPIYTPARDRILAEMMQSPDLEDANDYDHLGSECLASASTASGMLSRTDGFDTMPGLFPGIALDSSGSYSGAMTVQRNSSGLDMTQFVLYPTRDPFQLPPVLQAHLDETYAASSVVLTRVEGGGDDGAHRGLYQVTSYRPQNGRAGRGGGNVPGTTPLAYPSFRGVTSSPNHLGGTIIEFGGETAARGKTLVQLSQLPQRFTGTNSKKKTAVDRSLPFRKRPVEEVNSNEDDEEYSPPSSVIVAKKKLPLAENKNVLVRHNVRTLADGERVSCKCKKSQCLKLYCDCFQQNLMCTSDCECEKCKNTEANDCPGGSRDKAVTEIMLRRPDAFKPRKRDAEEGCKCKKNKCLKKYCICFNQGVKCDNRCRCRDCENQPVANDEEEEEYVPVIKVRLNPPTQKVAPKKKAKKEPRELSANMSVVYGLESPPAQSEQYCEVTEI